MKFLFICLFSLCSIGLFMVKAQCTFPTDFTGTWKHSVFGNIEFTTSAMQMTEYTDGPVTLNCETEITSGTKFILVSDAYNNSLTNEVYMLICMEVTRLKDNGYLYKVIQRTAKNTKAYNYRIIEAASNTATAENQVCTDSSTVPDTEYYLLMKSGVISSVKTDFPSTIQGKLAYTFDSTRCSGNNGLADICTDKTLIDFDYTKCSDVVGYTASGHLNVLYHTSSSNTYTIWTYNQDTSVDNNATYFFTCFKASTSGSTLITVSATQNPNFCDSTQTTTTAATNGKTITGTLTTCGAMSRIGEKSIFVLFVSYFLHCILR